MDTETQNIGGEAAIAAMTDSQRLGIGRKTMRFIWSIKQNNPELWAEIQRRAKEQEEETI